MKKYSCPTCGNPTMEAKDLWLKELARKDSEILWKTERIKFMESQINEAIETLKELRKLIAEDGDDNQESLSRKH